MLRYYRGPSIVLLLTLLASVGLSQPNDPDRQNVRTVSIPISIFTRQELKEDRLQEFIQLDRLVVREANDEQQILSIRSIEEAPLSLAILVQEDLTSNFNLQIQVLKRFITRL